MKMISMVMTMIMLMITPGVMGDNNIDDIIDDDGD